ncbi:methyltransferase domain-containing protein [Nitratireductor aquimarinus]|uniref:Methyltransferase domain-containing protein n=2 Tax=Phyllobacteriaceae TaxID=69277 RepID=A0ABU4AH70_9HYPH|nr:MULTISPECIES: class I SAM-dependent methyltransferase [Nitratireductor]MCA1261136.1 class I SAM-dependent methyltransferase [Nitratireductor aquimarinus]MDV6225574.1 methyltransferase domain-containing protein [Nitratireductor aquimarinus]
MMTVTDRWRPETAAGGFTRDDEDIAFYTRINALVRPDMVLVDLGAGRGSRFDEGTSPFRKDFCNFQGKVKHVIGLDVDPVVMEHPHLDEAHVIEPGGRLPLADSSVDIIVCEWVIEHVEHPQEFADEIHRVLKPGGWFCALTPNSYGYVGISNRIIPDSVKDRLMRLVWPERPHEDVFPTFYRMNTMGSVRRAFGEEKWTHHGYTANGTPRYHGNTAIGFAAVAFFQAIMPPPMRTNLLVFSQKRPDAASARAETAKAA